MAVEKGKRTLLATDDAGGRLEAGTFRERRCRRPGALRGDLADDGQGGLLGWSIPAAFGGEGAGFSDILPAVEAFVAKGGRPGIALSWMVHLIVGRVLIAGSGTAPRKRGSCRGWHPGKGPSPSLYPSRGPEATEADSNEGREKGKNLRARWGKGVAHQWPPGRSLRRICRDGERGGRRARRHFSSRGKTRGSPFVKCRPWAT